MENAEIEQLARMLRDTHYASPIKDAEWESVKNHWIKDARKFLELVKANGLMLCSASSPTPA